MITTVFSKGIPLVGSKLYELLGQSFLKVNLCMSIMMSICLTIFMIFYNPNTSKTKEELVKEELK